MVFLFDIIQLVKNAFILKRNEEVEIPNGVC
jgi:hypothetical protein